MKREFRRLRRVPCMLLAVWLSSAGIASAGERAGACAAESLPGMDGGLRPTVVGPEAPRPRWSLRARMAHYHVPGVAIAVIRDGEVVQAAGCGVRKAGAGEPIDADTVFSVGSVSKIVAAATTLRLVDAGKLSLDADVAGYLERWRVPEYAAGSPAVTLRMLLSHTAGFNVHGFDDYAPGAPLPNLLQTLRGQPPAKNEALRLVDAPGTRMRYSGGGVQVEQLVLEDVSGRDFAGLAASEVFVPLGMRRSTFENPLPERIGNIAHAHDRDGRPAAQPRGWESFPEQAASGLWTSAADLGTFVAALLQSHRERNGFLSRQVAGEMMTEVWPSLHGLGPRLLGEGRTRFFHHGGANDSYRAWIEGHLSSGNGLVVLTNGNRGGGLMMEIRNALTDALDDGINPPVLALPREAGIPPAEVVGTYVAAPEAAQAMSGNLAVLLASLRVSVQAVPGGLGLRVPQEPGEEDATFDLMPLTRTRFIAPDSGDPDLLHVVFRRDARGKVEGVQVDRGDARVYLRRIVP